MSTARRPEVFISATSADLRTCRQLIKESLLTLGCVPVEQTNFPPDYRTVREMLRAKIDACDAVIHLAGVVHGAEPRSRAHGEPRRSYTQMEYDLARELKKPLYVFVCGGDFSYDEHVPESDEERILQQAHRSALTAGDSLHYGVHSRDDLALRVRELQTHVESLGAQLKKTRSWLGRGLAIGLTAIALLGAGLWWQSREMAALRDLLNRHDQSSANDVIKQLGQQPTQIVDGRTSPLRIAQATLAERRGISLDQLQTQLAAESSDLRQVLDRIAQRRQQSLWEIQELDRLQADGLRKLGDAERASGHYAKAVSTYEQALTSSAITPAQAMDLQIRLGDALNEWAFVSEGPDVSRHLTKAIGAYRLALMLQTSPGSSLQRALVQNSLAGALRNHATLSGSEGAVSQLEEALGLFRSVLAIRTQDAFPAQWAVTQDNVASTLRDLSNRSPVSVRPGLLAQAALTYRNVLTAPRLSAAQRSRTEGNLILVLRDQAKVTSDASEARAVLDGAIRDCRLLLENYPRAAKPVHWANNQHCLALLLRDRASLSSPDDALPMLAEAVAVCRELLTVRTRGVNAQTWALSQHNLALCLLAQARLQRDSEKTNLLNSAAQACEAALEVYSSQPAQRASVQSTLAEIKAQRSSP